MLGDPADADLAHVLSGMTTRSPGGGASEGEPMGTKKTAERSLNGLVAALSIVSPLDHSEPCSFTILL